MNLPKVIVALSGGVDSAVAAWLLKQKGFEPIGVTFKMWRLKDDRAQAEAIERAARVCEILGISHLIADLQMEFEEQVVRHFADEYLAGLTPNPCVVCNHGIKWQNLLKLADECGAEKIATGHYVCTDFDPATGRYRILKGLDSSKDQSYALWQLTQPDLARTLFPLGELTKTAVKQISAEQNLIIGDIGESQDVCFIAEDDYRRFLMEYVPDKVRAIGRGELVDETGKVLGLHDGFYNFTIGQRKGFRIGFKERRYVKSIDASANRVVIATNESLFSARMIIRNFNWVSIPASDEFEGVVKARYNHKGVKAHGCRIDDNAYEIEFAEPQRAICPGQSAVVYQGDCLILGGIIHLPG
ncbi:MAG: tRNA 2-thiouridine(34) synthase MnmA [Candidatus Neomarinimicrobiota bacterium]